jgi:hypothetical protein
VSAWLGSGNGPLSRTEEGRKKGKREGGREGGKEGKIKNLIRFISMKHVKAAIYLPRRKTQAHLVSSVTPMKRLRKK